MTIFVIKEGMDDNTWMVGLDDKFYQLVEPYFQTGSYNIVASRILGFSYPDYLRYVRQNYNATLKGRAGYSYAIYKNWNDCYDIVALLNKKWREVEDELIGLLEE